MSQILVIEDDPNISDLIEYHLSREGHQVLVSPNGKEGIEKAKALSPSMILLDLMIPEIDGLEVCRLLRQNKSTKSIPIIILSAKAEETDKVIGLGLGADDYLTKPFSPRELMARIKAVWRRTETSQANPQQVDSDIIELGPISIDCNRYEVKINQNLTKVTIAEFRLLKALALKPGQVHSREQLLNEITKGESYVIDRNVDVHIGSLRKKLGEYQNWIETVRGVGYKMKES